jgi:hypothetical protein
VLHWYKETSFIFSRLRNKMKGEVPSVRYTSSGSILLLRNDNQDWALPDIATITCRINTANCSLQKSYTFWDITPRSPMKVNRRFGGTCRLHLNGRRISQARNKREAAMEESSRFLIGEFFDPEDGDTFLRKVGWLSTDYAALYPRRYNCP